MDTAARRKRRIRADRQIAPKRSPIALHDELFEMVTGGVAPVAQGERAHSPRACSAYCVDPADRDTLDVDRPR